MFRVTVCGQQPRRLIYFGDESLLRYALHVPGRILLLEVEIIGGVGWVCGTGSNTAIILSPTALNAHLQQLALHLGEDEARGVNLWLKCALENLVLHGTYLHQIFILALQE